MANLHMISSKTIIIIVVLALFSDNVISIATHMRKESIVGPDAIHYYSLQQMKVAPNLKKILESSKFLKSDGAHQIARTSPGGPDPHHHHFTNE